MKPLGKLLASSAQVRLVDLPGFGQSDAPNDVWDTFQYADRLVADLDEQQISQVDVVGHSFGGKVALSMAIRYPERVRRLVVMGTSGFRSCIPWHRRSRALLLKWLGRILRTLDAVVGSNYYRDWFISRYASVDYKNAGELRPILVKSIHDDLTAELERILCPTLILWGDKDQETPISIAHHLNKHIVDSRLVVHPGKGHLLFQDVGAHLCAHHILSFLGDATHG